MTVLHNLSFQLISPHLDVLLQKIYWKNKCCSRNIFTDYFKWLLVSLPLIIRESTRNIGLQDVLRKFSSNVLRTSPKDSIWLSQGRPRLTSWGRPEMMSRGRLNLTFKGRPWETDSGRSQDVLRTSPRGPSKDGSGAIWGHQLDVAISFFTFLLQLVRLSKSIGKQFNIQSLLRAQSNI